MAQKLSFHGAEKLHGSLERVPPSRYAGKYRDIRSRVDADGLRKKLLERIRGEVRFDSGSKALYATDGSNYRQIPLGVVLPKTIEDVVATIGAAREFGAPILSRGGGTSLAGQCCNVAVVMDFSKYMNRVISIDPNKRLARVQPGCVLDTLRGQAEKFHLTFGPDPATHDHCTLGGMTGNNSCGMHAQMAGRTSDNIDTLDIMLYDGTRLTVGKTSDEELSTLIREGGRRGEIYAGLRRIRDTYAEDIRTRYPKIPRRISGYALDELLPENGFNVARSLVGSESTCVTILEIGANLVYSPPARSLLVLGYPSVYEAADHVPDIVGYGPIALEGIDDLLIQYMRKKGLHVQDLVLLPPGGGWLVAEFGGETKAEADGKAHYLMSKLSRAKNPPSMKLYDDPHQEGLLWEVRESSLGATAYVPQHSDTWEGWEDSAVPPERLSGYLRDLRRLFDKYGYSPSLYGHFGQGCVHCRIDFDLVTENGLITYRHFMEEAADLVLKYGGSLSGEHGDGQSRAELLPKMFGERLIQAFREFKAIWDPGNDMNPGKIVDPYALTDNLRLGTDYAPPVLETHFSFQKEGWTFSRAALRCVGVGKCRRYEGGTMCPSYMATHEEMHSTRGRARLLFEMMNGEVIKDGWKSEEVKEALDLCLACKGCKGDCPVNVDMATYKAEFLSHYYHLRLRPRSAYAFGLIPIWAAIGSRIPGVLNFFSQTAPFDAVMKAFSGMAPARSIPLFAEKTFRAWYAERNTHAQTGPAVMLWVDTFNNNFHPDVLKSALLVLEQAGFNVRLSPPSACCGRPFYDFGMLGMAKRYLRHILRDLRCTIRESIPIIVLEPSCASVFRDELTNLMPHEIDAERLRGQVYLLSEFIDQHSLNFSLPEINRKALVHTHCHHKSVLKADTELNLIRKLKLDVSAPEPGCCGMAGAFGFEAGDHYDVSIKCGERNLAPAVRAADDETLIIADGFSCREQIRQLTQRKAMHFAEVIRHGLDGAQR